MMMYKQVYYSLVAGMLINIGLVTTATSNVVENIENFDKNKNSQIDPEEWPALSKHILSSLYRELDNDTDGEVSTEEFQKLLKDANGDASASSKIFETARKGRSGVPINEAVELWAAHDAVGAKDYAVKLRRSVKGITVLKDIDRLIDDQPATFSYSHDYSNDTDVWSAKGAFIYPFRTVNFANEIPHSGLYLETIASAFAISFDNKESGSPNDIGLVGFHADSEFEYVGGQFDAHYLTLDASYIHDFQTETSIASVELDWRPVYAPMALNSIWYTNQYVGIRGHAIGRASFSSVVDRGINTNFVGDEFLRLGADIGADIYFGEFYAQGRWLHASVRWSFLDEIEENSSSELFSASLDYYPAANPNFGFNVTYRNGDIPLFQTPIEEISAGLSIKF